MARGLDRGRSVAGSAARSASLTRKAVCLSRAGDRLSWAFPVVEQTLREALVANGEIVNSKVKPPHFKNSWFRMRTIKTNLKT